MFLHRAVLELENLLHRTSVRVEAYSSTFLLWATIWEKFIVSLLLKNYVIKPDFSHFSVVTFIVPKVSYVKFYSLLLIPPWFYRWLFDCYMQVVRTVSLVHGRLKSFVSFATGSEMWPLPSFPAGFLPLKSFLEPSWAVPIAFQCLWCSAFALLLSLPSLFSVPLVLCICSASIIAVPSLCSTIIILLTLPVSTWKGFCKESHSCTPSPSVLDPGFSSLQSYGFSALTV